MPSNFVNSKVEQKPEWNIFINNAKAQLAEVRDKLADLVEREKGLLIVIARFEKFRDEGEPFPVDIKKAETAAQAVPA
jgi:hypothetical protein